MEIKEYLTPPVVLILALLIISLLIIFPVLNMIILGAILAYAIRPIALKIKSKFKYETISIFLAIIIVLIPLILLLSYIVFEISSMVTWILANNTHLDINYIITEINNYIPTNINEASINSAIQKVGSYILNYIVSKSSKFANIILDLFILITSTFYFIRDGDKCIDFIKSFVPENSKEFFDNTILNIKSVLKSIFYGHILTSIIIGLFGCIGYFLLGYPYGIFLGVLTGILQLIPVFGPWPIYWILFFTDIISANYPRAAIVLIFGFFLSTVDMYIRPKLSSHYADIHPLILLVGFLSGPLVYGIVGFVVGPLILGITYAILDSFRKEYLIED